MCFSDFSHFLKTSPLSLYPRYFFIIIITNFRVPFSLFVIYYSCDSVHFDVYAIMSHACIVINMQ